MVKPIPQRLLIHAATLKTGKTLDEWSNPAWSGATPLSRVRFEPIQKLKLTRENKEIQCSLLMFFDCANSLPAGANFETGQTIAYGGQDYEVVGVDRLFDDERLHHLEVALL